MFNSEKDRFADQVEGRDDAIELVRRLDRFGKARDDHVNDVEQLLIRSRQLNSARSIRLIDQGIEKIPSADHRRKTHWNLSCNLLGRDRPIDWNALPVHLQTLDVSGNFLDDLHGIEQRSEDLQSLSVAFNDIDQVSHVFSHDHWSHLSLLDLSYNLLADLRLSVESLTHLEQLRVLYLHGNPLSLTMDYRLYVIDRLRRLSMLDDTSISAEERFRSRNFSQSAAHRQSAARFSIAFGSIENLPCPSVNQQNQWPLQVHRYQMRFDWFQPEDMPTEKPSDKMASFHRYSSCELSCPYSDWKPVLDFPVQSLEIFSGQLTSFRDFLFEGMRCRLVQQKTEYWPAGQVNEPAKSKGNVDSKEKANDLPARKKKNEDLSKLVVRTDPTERILSEYFVALRPFLDGDHQVSFQHQFTLADEHLPESDERILPRKDSKNPAKKVPPKSDEKRRDTSKSTSKDKDKIDVHADGKRHVFQCSARFQLHRYVTQEQLV